MKTSASRRLLPKLIMGVGFVVIQLMSTGLAQAAGTPLSLVTSPLPISLQTTPGSTVTTDIRVQQNGASTQELQVTLMKFGAYGDSGRPQLMDRGPNDSYFNWVSFSETKFAAAPNVWQDIKMTIHVPKSAAFDYYYAVVFSRVGDNARQTGDTNSIQGGSAVLVLLTAQVPWAKQSMSLTSFTAAHKIFEFLPATFSVKFSNTGNIHLVPQGDIFITQGNKQIASLDINSEQGNILPNTYRAYPVQWTDGFPHYEIKTAGGKVLLNKDGTDKMQLTWNNGSAGSSTIVPHLRFGEYTASLVAAYQNAQGVDVPLTASLTFWVIPWRFLLAVLAILLLVGVGVYAMVRGTLRGAKRLSRKR